MKKLMSWLLVIAMLIPLCGQLPAWATSSDKLELLSVTALDNYTIELKFSEALNTTDVDGTPWIVKQFTTSPGVTAGIALVSDEKIGSNGYYIVEKETTIAGTISLGETADTLIWKVNSPGESTSISNVMESWPKDGYSVKFYLKDNDAFNYAAGHIGYVQTPDARALSIPADYARTESFGWEYMFADIDASSAKFEFLSATVLNDYQIELKFSQNVGSATVDRLNATTPYCGVTLVSNEKTNGYYTVESRDLIKGTVAFGEDNKTLIWTANESIAQLSTKLAKDGYSVKFYFYEAANAWFTTALNNQSVVTVQDTYAMPLWIPEEYRNPNADVSDYMFMDITPADELKLVSVETISEYTLQVTFNKAIVSDASVNPKVNLNANLRLLNADGSWYYKNDVDYGYSIGNAMQPTDDPKVWTWTMPVEYAGIGSTDMGTGKIKENNRSINYVLDTWKEMTAAGYKATFMLIDGADDGTLVLTDPATYPGYSKRIQAVDGGYLKTTHRNGENDYVFQEISAYVADLELLSVTQVGDYQLELKFNQVLKTTDVSGTPWIVNTINNTTNVKIGMAWVADSVTGQESFGSVATDAIDGTVALGDTNDTLIWTVSNRVPANLISALMRETKEGYTRKFYLYDNGCGWYSEGGSIGAIQSAADKALLIPESNKHAGNVGSEYLFMDITPDSSFTLVSATAINDYQLKLQFSEALKETNGDGSKTWPDIMNDTANLYMGIVWAQDNVTEYQGFGAPVITGTQVTGTVAWGDTHDTLIWTVSNQTEENKISALLSESLSGYTKKFYFYDGGCAWTSSYGYIGAVQNTAGQSLKIPGDLQKTTGSYAYEYLLMDIDSFVNYEQGETIALQDKDYHFMNADTGRSLVVNGTDEFTVERITADSNIIALKVGEQYVNLHSTPATLSDTAYHYLLEACEYDRYRLLVAPDLALSDVDTGTGNEASLSYVYPSLTPISTGWYLTASGDAKPLRVLPIGDSITYGSNPDGFVHAWRDELSADLVDQFTRVVFVGSQTSKTSSIAEKALYRHEGNPGWTVSHMGSSLADIADGVVAKYDPDVVLLMAGINDMGSYDANSYTDEQALAALKPAYKTLVEKLAAHMEEDDVIFCSTLTPTFYASGENNPAVVNAVFPSWVKEWAAEGLPVALNDNYTALKDNSGVCSSDTLHLSNEGDALVAQQYAGSIAGMYDADGTMKTLQERLDWAKTNGLAEVYLNADASVTNLNVPDTTTLDLNGHTLTAEGVVAIGNIIDATEGEGKIKIAKNVEGDNKLILASTNTMLPLYDTDGYRFFSFTFDYKIKEQTDTNKIKYAIRVELPSAKAYALLDDADNYEMLSIPLVLSRNGEEYERINYTFQQTTIEEYVTKSTADLSMDYGLMLTVSGLDEAAEYGVTLTASASLAMPGAPIIKAY